LAYARELQAALVTFDRALHEFARKQGQAIVIPA
jgi:predicted nucleic acid-binding protein